MCASISAFFTGPLLHAIGLYRAEGLHERAPRKCTRSYGYGTFTRVKTSQRLHESGVTLLLLRQMAPVALVRTRAYRARQNSLRSLLHRRSQSAASNQPLAGQRSPDHFHIEEYQVPDADMGGWTSLPFACAASEDSASTPSRTPDPTVAPHSPAFHLPPIDALRFSWLHLPIAALAESTGVISAIPRRTKYLPGLKSTGQLLQVGRRSVGPTA
jgi:hypothetical protein